MEYNTIKIDEKWNIARDKVAIKYGFKSWSQWSERRTLPFSELLYYEVALIFKNL